MTTFYEFLNLTGYASNDEIKAALAQKRTELDSEKQHVETGHYKSLMNRCVAAERVLLNPNLRSRYDQELRTREAEKRGSQKSAQFLVTAQNSTRNSSPSTPASPPNPTNFSTNSSATAPQNPSTITLGNCPVCNEAKGQSSYCLVCGYDFGDQRTGNSSAGSSVENNADFHGPVSGQETKTPIYLAQFFRLIRWGYAQGIIVSAEVPHHSDKEFQWLSLILKCGVALLLIWLFYRWITYFFCLIAVAGILVLFLSGIGIIFSLFTSLLSFVSRGFGSGPQKQVIVRDVRVRQQDGSEVSVRFRGELRSGQFMVGDRVEVWGVNRGGMIMARFGYNFRTLSQIWVKYQ